MTMKRSWDSDIFYGTKRQKEDQSSLIETFITENSLDCLECQKDPFTDCINFDFPPRMYFSLALILEDSSRRLLLKDQDDITLFQLSEYAAKLSLDNKLALAILSKLQTLCSCFTNESIQELSSLLSNKKLHQQRELRFIGSCLESLTQTTLDIIESQSTNEEINLGYIVFSDVRAARLLPLLSIIYEDVLQIRPVDLTISDDDGSFISTFIMKQNNSMDVFELDEDGNIIGSITTQESPDPFILPAPSEITLSDGVVEGDNLSIRFQSPDISLRSFPDSQELSIPDYDVFTTAELKSKLKQYGFKTSNNRATMIKDLQKIYTSINSSSQTSTASQKRVITPDAEACVNSPSPPSSSQNIDTDLRKKIINHIKSKPDLMEKILNYESVSVDECNDGLNCKKSAVKSVLDEFGATSELANKKFKASN